MIAKPARRDGWKYREYKRIWNKRKRAEVRAFVTDAKKGPCVDCGGTFDPICMDFDHRPGVIKFANVSDVQLGLAIVRAEIAKCDLVCANCHRLRTRDRGQHTTKQRGTR